MSRAARDELRARVHRRLLAETSVASPAELVVEEAPLLPSAEVARVVDDVLADMHGLGRLDRLLADASVSEVIVNGDGRVWVEREGRLAVVAEGLSHGEIHHLVEKIVAPLGLRADRSSPLVDARLPDGSRVNAVLPPLAVDGPCLTVRRFPAASLGIADFCPPPVAAFLRWAVAARCNIVVTGATSSGKTSLLGALASGVVAGERVVTVEDAAELRLQCDHVVRLEARPANAEGAGEVTVRDLVRNALRMRPDRIVVGEVRGSEAFDMVQAMNTGHDGSLSTCHANGPVDALRRVETLALLAGTGLPVEAVREQLLAAVDLVVHVARGRDGRRSVTEVCEPVLPAADESAVCRVRRLAGPTAVVAPPTRPPRDVSVPPFEEAA
ncbi:MAG TPA: CpaF family protein [Acidimicrobiales bacterium]|nr:CpaF family protein [Acidimicrobiales bacterium]